ncbi:MAG: TetR/AcrR family transcriptional regulator [Spirochaetales bacterium]|nr:TetR/AcrR family transcriptional regulator [Spirochaetales bacterium]
MRQKDENKREAIYQSALELITTEGLTGASMAKIAKKAHVSPATIYIYFENKEDMLNKLYLMIKGELSDYIFRDYHNDLSITEGMKLYMKSLFHFMVSHPFHLSFHEQFYNSPVIKQEVKEEAMAGYTPLFNLYEQSYREGLVKIPLLELAGVYLTSPIMDLAKLHRSGAIEVNEEVLNEALEMSLRAIMG